MSASVPYVSFDLKDSNLKRGQTWVQLGQQLAAGVMDHHDKPVLDWLEHTMRGRWNFGVFVTRLPITALSDPNAPVVRVGVELTFAKVSDAVLFKLTWGGTERF